MIYHIEVPEFFIDQEKSMISTPLSIESVLYFLSIFGSVGRRLMSGNVVPERR